MSALLTRADVQEMLDERLGRFGALVAQLQGALTSIVAPAPSSAGIGPGAVGADVLYTPISLVLDAGTWMVYGQATLGCASAPDGKQLGLYNVTAGAAVPGSRSPVAEVAIGSNVGFVTMTVVVLDVASVLQMVAYRNGASQTSIGYPGGLPDEQRMMAWRRF